MKKYVVLLLMVLAVFSSHAQFGVELGLGSQNMDRIIGGKQYFSVNPAVRLQGSIFFLRVGMRKSIPRTYPNPNSTDRYSFEETGVMLGAGLTTSGSESMTKPYFMFEYGIMSSKSGKRNTIEYRSLRFSGGFQFRVKHSQLCLFNEASFTLSGGDYGTSFAIDLGIRYYFKKK